MLFGTSSIFKEINLNKLTLFSNFDDVLGEKVVNNWSRFVLIIWAFMVLILTQSYTASLASMLMVQQLKPEFVHVTEIKRNVYFVKKFLR